ncbi:MAG: RecQ family ATP-dependent DNA helicase [Paludibacteraceae bacterium]|nr:RecQ family ATP-dependent DNA helicase [Paludibacteraceae bacterium]
MSIFSKILSDIIPVGKEKNANKDRNNWVILDTEVGLKDKKLHDIGALHCNGGTYHGASRKELEEMMKDVDFVCGHNIIHHDIKYLFGDRKLPWVLVDTLYISPLLFPERPYHRLIKDDKLQSEQLNNPVNDCVKARDLLMDEINAWNMLNPNKRAIFHNLLKGTKEFEGFLLMVSDETRITDDELESTIFNEYRGKICEHADLGTMIGKHPCELAFALALIGTTNHRSVTPPWVLHNYPLVENIINELRHTICQERCEYCDNNLNVNKNLKKFFGFDQFRKYEGEPLQENAARAAVEGRSLLAVFPTGGGKSLTFQLPAMMAGESLHGLTVVISPLQSLMKDQVDNLAERGITDVVTINGLLDPISRSLAIERTMEGEASLLYIAPEMLRSKTIEKIMLSRNIVRFVIDEAHCFSSWGQDFRVDYLYIGKFIRELQEKKKCGRPIPVSCFTATAKQKVIQDIHEYFKKELGLELELFASRATRTNLRYSVINAETDEEKYQKLRSLIAEANCPTIVYVSRTRRTLKLAEKLNRDGFKALPFNGKMDADKKIANQNAFMHDEVQIMVATSAFGMGVDKKDVGLVVHYDISDSLENYVQEAGRAGRDPHLNAKCYVLFNNGDLDKHFILLNQTKLNISEIQQIWSAIKGMTKHRQRVCCSALEIARSAGWDDTVPDIETRVRTAISALEQSEYLERGNNVPHVYATGITVKNMDEARKRLTDSKLFDGKEFENAIRIIKSLITHKNTSGTAEGETETRVDYIADVLGLSKEDVVSAVERMRQEGILADSKEISAFMNNAGDSEHKSMLLLERFSKLEEFLLRKIPNDAWRISCKQINDNAIHEGIATSKEKDIRTLLYFLTVKGYVHKKEDFTHNLEVSLQNNFSDTIKRFEKRIGICRYAVEWLYRQAIRNVGSVKQNEKEGTIRFSVVELLNDLRNEQSLFGNEFRDVTLDEVEESLLYLSKIGALKLEGGFLVLYNAMDIRRLKDNKLRYKQEDYRRLDEFYKLKIQQVHIVGEYANLMVRDENAALGFVQDYFQIDYKKFISKYFKGERQKDIQRNLTPDKYNHLFGQLSERQMEIISDYKSRCIVVAAGPGSGKTRVLAHKLASLLTMEDVKHEQLLMLTFSRAAATEFKQRLMQLIGNAANYVEIKTFHSYCFDLLGKIGNIEESSDVVERAARMISDGEVEPNKISKSVLVIDEAQDMSEGEYNLVRALMGANEEMRVIAVGDDDQNIFEFRGSNSYYMSRLTKEEGSRFIEMTENYRSSRNVVAFANGFVGKIKNRLKNTPIVSMSKNDGWVSVTHHHSDSLFTPLIEEMMRNRSEGSACVLTQTNEEAAIVVALLRKRGINGKLIQSMDGFRFMNLAEMRYFMRQLSLRVKTPFINDEAWNEAKEATLRCYEGSECLGYVERCLQLFDETHVSKYQSDFAEYVFESSIEDFTDYGSSDVVVSTIHKAKGREFDDVYMLVDDRFKNGDLQNRRYYVGMTRAKNRLFIHTSGSSFDGIKADKRVDDQRFYGLPDHILLQQTMKDVYLGFFKDKKEKILRLRAGMGLVYRNFTLYHGEIAVATLSRKMQGEMKEWMERGFRVSSAKVGFIVAWKAADAPKEEKETAVLLADISMVRSRNQLEEKHEY